jgi:hypothetical protein
VQHGSLRFPISHRRSDPWATVEALKIAQDERSFVVVNLAPPRSPLTEEMVADLASARTPIAATCERRDPASAGSYTTALSVPRSATLPDRRPQHRALDHEPRRLILGLQRRGFHRQARLSPRLRGSYGVFDAAKPRRHHLHQCNTVADP